MKKTLTKPKEGDPDHGVALDADKLARLVAGFKGSRFYPIVAVLPATGMRRSIARIEMDRRRLQQGDALDQALAGEKQAGHQIQVAEDQTRRSRR
jgi:hypothetical protein